MNDELSEITNSVRKHIPLIIFTNQRTGSTSLTKWFWNDHSKRTDYEGLNQAIKKLGYKINESSFHDLEILDESDGPYKHAFKQYKKEKQKNPKEALEKIEVFIKTVMSFRPTFKIMTEYTSIEICNLVIKYLNYYDYNCILLYRKNAFDRCKSLNFSLSTEIYSPLKGPYATRINAIEKLNKNEFNLGINDDRIDRLVHLQKLGNENNIAIWDMLKTSGCRYASISYEDLFEKSLNNNTVLHMACSWLYYDIKDFESLKQDGKMGADKYYNVKGIEKLKLEIDKLDNPTFSNLHFKVI